MEIIKIFSGLKEKEAFEFFRPMIKGRDF